MTAYDDLVLAENPRFYWPLGELGGTVAHDLSGNGFHGTYNGSPTFGAQGLLACREPSDRAVYFDGGRPTGGPETNDFVHRLTSPLSGPGDFTLEVWFALEVDPFSTPSRRYMNMIQQRRDNGNNYSGMVRVYTNAAFPQTPTGFGLAANSDQPIVNDTLESIFPRVGCWNHLAVVYDAPTFTLWLNGSPRGSASIPGFSLTPNYLSFGADAPTALVSNEEEAELLRGRMAKAAGYAYALTPEQIAARFALGCTRCGASGGWAIGIPFGTAAQGWS